MSVRFNFKTERKIQFGVQAGVRHVVLPFHGGNGGNPPHYITLHCSGTTLVIGAADNITMTHDTIMTTIGGLDPETIGTLDADMMPT